MIIAGKVLRVTAPSEINKRLIRLFLFLTRNKTICYNICEEIAMGTCSCLI